MGLRFAATSALLVMSLLLAACPKTVAPPAPAPPVPPPPAPITAAECPRIERIEVRKSERVLRAECQGGGVLVYPIALSREDGPKRQQGDQRMPEGDYRVVDPPRKSSRFHVFIPIDYPSRADADLALRERRIDQTVHSAIVAAHRKGSLPPQHTVLGGALGIHGEGKRWRGYLEVDWTEGCVAVTDAAIVEIARRVRKGTPVRIVP
jgi:murein L,D-transpeptidase YafK